MKTKKVFITALWVLSLSVLFFFNSCSKINNCYALATGQNPFLRIEIKNAQNQNLLDPATVGHYDTATIRKLNGNILLSRPGFVPVVIGFNYTTATGNQIFSLTATDQDTVNIATIAVTQQCNINYALQSVKYNGITLQADSALFYSVHK